MRLYDLGGRDEQPEVVRDRVLTVPNLMSLARLIVLPWLYLDLSSGTQTGLARGLAIGIVFGATDWLDGYVARRFDQVSRIGKALDPISDRLFIGTVGVAIVVADVVPWWPIAAVLLRDGLFLVAALVLLGQHRQPPPVTRLGKTATFGLMWSFPFLIGAAIVGSPADPQPVLQVIGWVMLVVNLVLYYVVAMQYVVLLTRKDDGGIGV